MWYKNKEVMKLTSEQIGLMLERSSKVDRDYKTMSMNERYYRILYLFQRRKQDEADNYIRKSFIPEKSDYNKIIIGHTTTTWERISKRTHKHVINIINK